ncbi:B12-binding domain-containing radical SAM protein [Desulfosporosinus metallidurans]|uniref:Radical SAM domain protein n=1 Tax=Desulfosporosinus metallidurans TaxID=1888891 RepID=A0A1Q8QQ80_9FIRM|nr:radical SAM protein [Desulfosporosinus metallidurans]OLN29408.1 Radical SAM domain protein [Desulfosporosinus metallidurans]
MKENFRVVLINPSNGTIPADLYAPTEHLGLAYLAAVLRCNGFPVKIIDAYALNLSYEEVLKETLDFRPSFIGLTAEYNTIEQAMKLATEFKEKLPEVYITFGGEHTTFSTIEIFNECIAVDLVIRGEGEITIVEVMNRLVENKDLTNVDGVYFRGNQGEIVTNKERAAIADLDTLPFPVRDTLDACIERGITPAISILASRGCHANCSFCNASKFFNLGGGSHWRSRDPKKVVDELEFLLERYKDYPIYEVVYFNDENFVGPDPDGIRRVHEIAREIKKRNLKLSFEIFCRADSFDGYEEVVKDLSEAGLISALVGLESGYQKQLNSFGKGTTVDQNLNTIEIFKNHNIITSSSGFLMFNPYSNFKEIEENAKFLLSIGMSTLYNMSLKVLGYPGIGMNNKLKRDELLEEDFGHRNVSGYRFIDKRIGILAEKLNFNEAIKRKEDAAHRYLDFMMANLDKKLARIHMMETQNEQVFFLKKIVINQRFNANLVTYNFFLRSVILAETGWNQKAFEEYKESYISEISAALQVMNDSFVAYISFLEEVIA